VVMQAARSFASWASEASSAAQTAGVLTSEMLGLQRVAMTADIQMEDMRNMLTRLQNTLYDAANGSEEARDKFERLGLDAKKLAGMDPASALVEVAKAAERSEIPLQTLSDIFGEKLGPKAVQAMQELATNGIPPVSDAVAELADWIEGAGDTWAVFVDEFKKGTVDMVDTAATNYSKIVAFWSNVFSTPGKIIDLSAGSNAMNAVEEQKKAEREYNRQSRRAEQNRRAQQVVKMFDKNEGEQRNDAADRMEDARARGRQQVRSLLTRFSERASGIGGEGLTGDSAARTGGFFGNSRAGLGIADRQLRLAMEAQNTRREIKRVIEEVRSEIAALRESQEGGSAI